ncbi:MAG: hypothetical protein IKB28_03460 [Clostridia bacterium]|nr:hypothetical protein [Clostridia bacterium]
MKRILIVALMLLVCGTCLFSCDAITEEIGKSVSVEALNKVEEELRAENAFDTLERDDQEFIADFANALNEDGISLKGEITGTLVGSTVNQETGNWAQQITIGLSATEDVDTLIQYLEGEYATELEEGKAIIIDGGWIVSVTVASFPIEE